MADAVILTLAAMAVSPILGLTALCVIAVVAASTIEIVERIQTDSTGQK